MLNSWYLLIFSKVHSFWIFILLTTFAFCLNIFVRKTQYSKSNRFTIIFSAKLTHKNLFKDLKMCINILTTWFNFFNLRLWKYVVNSSYWQLCNGTLFVVIVYIHPWKKPLLLWKFYLVFFFKFQECPLTAWKNGSWRNFGGAGCIFIKLQAKIYYFR